MMPAPPLSKEMGPVRASLGTVNVRLVPSGFMLSGSTSIIKGVPLVFIPSSAILVSFSKNCSPTTVTICPTFAEASAPSAGVPKVEVAAIEVRSVDNPDEPPYVTTL